jgi:hypothetical protein
VGSRIMHKTHLRPFPFTVFQYTVSQTL